MGTCLRVYIPTQPYAWSLCSSFFSVICCWLVEGLLCSALQVLVGSSTVSLGNTSGCSCNGSLLWMWFLNLGSLAIVVCPVVAWVSDLCCGLLSSWCWFNRLSYFNSCAVYFILVRNLTIVLSSSSVRGHSFVLGLIHR